MPLVAHAQERVRRIGVLTGAADDPEMQARNGAFVDALQQLGWTDGRNVRIEYRWAGGDADLQRRYAAELVALAPDVILTGGSAPMGPLQQATRTVPELGALQRLDAQARQLEFFVNGPSLETHIARERARSSDYDGRSVFGWEKDVHLLKREPEP